MINRWFLTLACRALAHEGVIAYPTETVFGLGCDPFSATAVARILSLKNRPWQKGLILIGANFEQLSPFIQLPNRAIMKSVLRSWPGPVTWTFEATPLVPAWIRGDHTTVAVRLSSHPMAQALCHRYRSAIVSTSANISGRPPTQHPTQVRRWFGEQIDYILPGHAGPYRQPSEIRDVRTQQVLRASSTTAIAKQQTGKKV